MWKFLVDFKSPHMVTTQHPYEAHIQTSQELQMLSSVTLNCQVTQIVKKPSSPLSEM